MEKVGLLVKPLSIYGKIQDYGQLIKIRLASLVVFSAAMAFLMAPGQVDWNKLICLIIGGFLVTGSANGFNQIIEKEKDKLMQRTVTRPLPDQRMGVMEAFIACSLLGIVGVACLTFYMGELSGLLGLLAIVLYTVCYTPLKQKTPFAVFVGAFPGAIPPLLGWVAATGNIGLVGWVLFAIQFMWQFPHFWAIAWVLDDDYKKAGFSLLPTGKRDSGSAFQSLVYTVSLIPIGIMPFVFNISGMIALVVMMLVTIYFVYLAYKLYKSCEMADARNLMIGSFLYLPVVQIIMVVDKI